MCAFSNVSCLLGQCEVSCVVYTSLVTFNVWLKKTIVCCSFHMVAERRSKVPWTQCHHQKGLVPESSLASEEQELTEIDTLKKQLEKSKAEQEKMNATIQDLIKMMEVFPEKEEHKG